MHKLQECRSLQEAEPFLRGAKPTFRKTVETAILLGKSANPEQRALGESFMQIAIRELDAAEQPAEHHGDNGVKPKGEHFVKEELLADGNKDGTDGSEQSSSNSGPTPKEGTDEPDGDMVTPGMSTENQMTEAFGQPPPGGMPGMAPPGLDPQLAQQMAPQMPQMPPMSTPQQVQQMQYTVKQYMETYLKPVREQVIRLTKANTFLSKQIKEMQTISHGLDINKFSKDNKIPRIQEMSMPTSVTNIEQNGPQAPRIYEKAYNLEKERQSIADIDKMIATSGNRPYQ